MKKNGEKKEWISVRILFVVCLFVCLFCRLFFMRKEKERKREINAQGIAIEELENQQHQSPWYNH